MKRREFIKLLGGAARDGQWWRVLRRSEKNTR